jgi:TolA-binding protein
MYFKKGEIYYGIGNYQQALVSYSDFVKYFSQSTLVPNAYYWIGKSYVNSGSPSGAKNNFKTVVDGYLTSEVGIDAAIELGKILNTEEDYKGAEAVYDKTIKALPDSKRIPEILFEKAAICLKTNNIAKAYDTYNDIISYHDNSVFSAKAKIELGLLELAGGRPESAEALFRSQSESKVDDLAAKAQYYLGEALYNQNKFEDAITALVRIRSVFSMYDEWLTKSLIKLGDCYVQLKDKQKAKEMYQAVLIRHKNDSYANEANNKLNKL